MEFDFLLDYRSFDTSAEVFWDLPLNATSYSVYHIYLDGVKKAEVCKTHYSLEGLLPEHEYDVEVRLIKENNAAADTMEESLGHITVKTGVTKRKIDISKAPYNALGDGCTLNTLAIQRALDACDKDSFIYIPAGTFLSGALNVHSDTEIYLEDGALLQGTDNPDDYLPKIHSRFEGIEMECYRSLLNLGSLDHNAGYNCKNVIIHGKGSIMGGGAPLAKAIAKESGAVFINVRISNLMSKWFGDAQKLGEFHYIMTSTFHGQIALFFHT